MNTNAQQQFQQIQANQQQQQVNRHKKTLITLSLSPSACSYHNITLLNSDATNSKCGIKCWPGRQYTEYDIRSEHTKRRGWRERKWLNDEPSWFTAKYTIRWNTIQFEQYGVNDEQW